ncbi:hypothetical protein YQE_09788, partial [Dendroctonus ponderosae]
MSCRFGVDVRSMLPLLQSEKVTPEASKVRMPTNPEVSMLDLLLQGEAKVHGSGPFHEQTSERESQKTSNNKNGSSAHSAPKATSSSRRCGATPIGSARKNRSLAALFATTGPQFRCENCWRRYKNLVSLRRHLKYECQKEPQFHCLFCSYKAKLHCNLLKHLTLKHS